MKKLLLIGCVFILITLACGGNKTPQAGKQSEPPASGKKNTPAAQADAPQPSASYKIGQDVQVGEIRWKIIAAKDEGHELKSANEFIKPKSTSGKFIRLTFELENKSKDLKTFAGLDVVDAQDRKYKSSSDGLMFIEQDRQCVFENINPNITKTCQAIYELPKDATGLKANVGDLSLFGSQEEFIDLSL